VKPKPPQKQLDGFIAKYTPPIRSLARAIHAKMRARLPGAVEMVYDNYNALVIGFGPNERASDAIFSIVLYPRWINLFFLQGAGLPDPHRLLKGSGKVVRHIVIEGADNLDKPEIEELIASALERARTPFDGLGRRRLVIKSVSEVQRPRRPGRKPI
jgi:hypothetical protein